MPKVAEDQGWGFQQGMGSWYQWAACGPDRSLLRGCPVCMGCGAASPASPCDLLGAHFSPVVTTRSVSRHGQMSSGEGKTAPGESHQRHTPASKFALNRCCRVTQILC